MAKGVQLSNIDLRVVDYSRVSTNNLEQKKSLKNQVEHFEEYIKQNDKWQHVGSYIDAGITGTSDTKRENFMKMIEEAKKGNFDMIITKEISRFSRNTLDSIKYTRELLEVGVAVFFVNDNINTIMPDAELRLTIMSSLAQDEIRRLSERVKFGMNHAIKRGKILGNNTLYGYNKNTKDNKLEIIESESQVIKLIYDKYAIEKLSLTKIANLLNKNKKQFKKWYPSTISRIIANPKYKGYYCGKKTEVVDYITKKINHIEKKSWIVYKNTESIEPIINENIWNLANERLEQNKKSSSKKQAEQYCYSNKITCGKDKKIFYRRKFLRNKEDYTWICKNYLENGKSSCNSPNIRESELDKIFKNIIEILELDLNKIFNTLIEYYISHNMDCSKENDNRKKKDINNKKSKLLELLLQNYITKEEYHEKKEKYDDELLDIDKILSKNKTNIKKIKTFLNNNINKQIIYKKLINLLVSKIIAEKISTNIIELEIYLSYVESTNKVFMMKKTYEFEREKNKIYYKVTCYLNKFTE